MSELYLCQMYGTDTFERVKVRHILDNEFGQQEKAIVTCVDVGSTHSVRVTTLFVLQDNLKNFPFQVRPIG